MAKATAECTCRKCGGEFTKVTYKQNRRLADEWEEWAPTYFDLCEDCYKEEQDQEIAERAEGLPELSGSEKQIAWAIKIRDKFVRKKNESENRKDLFLILDFMLQHEDQASFWIDHRHDEDTMFYKMYAKDWKEEIMKWFEKQQEEPEAEEPEVPAEIEKPEEEQLWSEKYNLYWECEGENIPLIENGEPDYKNIRKMSRYIDPYDTYDDNLDLCGLRSDLWGGPESFGLRWGNEENPLDPVVDVCGEQVTFHFIER